MLCCRSSFPPKTELLWSTWLIKASKLLPHLAVAANKLLLSAHTMSRAAKRNYRTWGCNYTSLCNSLGLATAEKLVSMKTMWSTTGLAKLDITFHYSF